MDTAATVFCEQCGADLPEQAKFCNRCGTAQPSASVPAMPSAPDTRGGEPRTIASTAATSSMAAPDHSLPSTPSPAPAQRYTVCTIRDVLDGPHEIAESFLYPVPGLERDAIVGEPRDGRDVKRLTCAAIEVASVGASKPLLRVKDISASVAISEARVTIACSKYDKGGGWRGWGIGGLALSVPLNVASHALAARRRRGRMLVGQVRYPWITAVYAQNRVGFGGAERLRIIANAGGQSRLRLDLTLPKDVDATAVAAELTHRAARFRLAHDDQMSEQERVRFLELSRVAAPVYDKSTGKMAGFEFPTSWPVSERSARFGLPTPDAHR